MVTGDELRARMATAEATTGSGLFAGRPGARTARLLRLRAHAAADEVVARFGKWLHPMDRMDFARVERETNEALEVFEREGWLASPRSYHQDPPELGDHDLKRVERRGRSFEELTLTSGYEIHSEEPGRDRWLSTEYERNRVVHARVFRHDGPPRPWIVCVHGTGMGWTATDFTAFGVDRLHRDLGLNVMLPVLPLSGPRRARGRFEIRFPTNDHVDNVHGLAQSVWDLRRLIGWIHEVGGEQVVTHGVSLGGYVVALHAAFQPDLTGVIAGIPAVDFMALFAQNLDTVALRDHPKLIEGGVALHRVVSPLEFEPCPPVPHRFVYGALGDRFVDPVEQAYALWEHWDEPPLAWYEGGHLAFARSNEVQRFVTQALAATGMLR